MRNKFPYRRKTARDMNDIPEHNYESQEQRTLIDYLEQLHLVFCAFPNNIWTPSQKQKTDAYMLGQRKGFPDLVVIVPCGDGIRRLVFIELKRTKDYSVAPEQLAWNVALRQCEGVDSFICVGKDEAVRVIEKLMKTKNPAELSRAGLNLEWEIKSAQKSGKGKEEDNRADNQAADKG